MRGSCRRAVERSGAGAALALATALWPVAARADRRPTLATDAFYVGARIDPGVALLAGWDLDVYLTPNRAISLGPGVSLALLGGTAPGGRTQDLLLAADLLRLKVGASAPGQWFRPFFMVGGGFSWVRLTEQYEHGVAVVSPADHAATPTVGDRRYPTLEAFAPMLTLGAGVDLFVNGPLGATLLLTAHLQFDNPDRMPTTWLEVSAGIRFGP